MKKQVILRPVYNRPEMLYLSLEYEYKARETYKLPDADFHTIFVVEHGATPEVLSMVKNYKYEKSVLFRERKYGLSVNILEGMRSAFSMAEDYIIYLEDDILVHSTYFRYIDAIMRKDDLQNFSVISAFNFSDNGDVNKVYKDRHYAALAPLITKRFYESYIKPHSCNAFYSNPATYVTALDNAYSKYQSDRTYRYKKDIHHQQAGLINRLCDVARIEEDMYVVMPEVSRFQHIGMYGYNRHMGKPLKGNTLSKRIDNLRTIIQDANLMYDMAGSKEYNDYRVFSDKLNSWDGTIILSDKHFRS